MMRKRLISAIVLFTLMGIVSITGYAQDKKEVMVADRVIAVVGDRMILQSDLQMTEAYMKEQSGIPFSEKLSDDEIANLLNNMMTQKLLAAQAELDSLELSDANVLSSVEARITQLIQDLGSVQAVESKYRKPLFMLRVELMDQMREQTLAQMMTQEIRNKVIITPKEVKKIVNGMNKDSLALIPDQYEYSQIMLKAPSTEETRSAVKERLLDLRERIMNGGNFSAFATLYSDHESAKRSGNMSVTPQMVVPEFADAMVSLPIGGVSNIIETEEGYHLIQLISKANDKYNIKHILMRTKFSLEDLEKAHNRLDSIRTAINDETITFAEAAGKYSDDEETKITGGKMVNSAQSNYYGVAELKSTLFFANDLEADYSALSNLEVGEVSEPYQTYDASGNIVYKIVRLDRLVKEHTADFENDYNFLRELALAKKTDAEFQKWLKKQKARMYVRIEEPYSNYDIIDEAWSK